MQLYIVTKRVLLTAPFLFASWPPRYSPLLPALILATGGYVHAASDCSSTEFDTTVRVSHVYDGDTVKLRDGRKLRFIGLNTPEIKHRNSPAEPFANAARLRLLELLGHNFQLKLRFDNQRQDHYGRQLAHVYLPDGRSINHILISEGLAMALRVPPNDWQHACYANTEIQAKKQRRGIWSHPRYQPVPVSALDKKARGYRFVTGRISRIGNSRLISMDQSWRPVCHTY